MAAGDTSSGAQKTQISSQALTRMASELQQLVGQFQFETAEIPHSAPREVARGKRMTGLSGVV